MRRQIGRDGRVVVGGMGEHLGGELTADFGRERAAAFTGAREAELTVAAYRSAVAQRRR